ncbi:sensor domain-containing diguanylate cyclase [Achromobacter deleyi]|uniref:GGDEF domain-containing protein n=1 Tax=Achromobacter deleyi TaxID=1353891 RepID=UPI001492B183|nr:GGDEF domain-containing protein [Achromobacter deleyi]QVQ25807.1 GGDEF domain-containing protein [Achromobacter deleyi]UIP21346.1 GGDEF domain-containing protein [Achromobacter deleyi]
MDIGLKFSLPKWRLTRWLTYTGQDTPADIRAALIASLFGTLPIFAGGVINTLMISGVVTWRRPEPLYISWLALELVLAIVRVTILRMALRAAPKGGNTHTDIYILLALLWAFSVGYGVFITFINGDWLAATLAGVSCGAMAGGICFRNYGAPRLVGAMIFLSLGPMCLGALFTGEYVTAIVFIQIPFYLISMSIASHRLNRILVSTMQAERDSDRRASEDVLTGLANRAGLQAALERVCSSARGHDSAAALLYMDMDDFKRINDTHGHAAGDQVLKTIADRMRAMLRVDDVAARIGGDEFIVLVTGIDATAALRLGEHLLRDASQPIALADGTRVSVGLSIGISIMSGANRTPQAALDSADAALYRAKAQGGRRCVVDVAEEPADEALPGDASVAV